MGEFKKVFWGCLAFQVVPILLFVLLAVLSAQGTVLLPDSLWFMPVIYFTNGVVCMTIIAIQCNKVFKRLVHNEHESLFDYFFRYYTNITCKGLAKSVNIDDIENAVIKELFKSCMVSSGLILFVNFVEIAVATTVLSYLS